jgi:hypothetical protein
MPRDLYQNLEFRFAPPLLVWCSGCWAAHEPNGHHDRATDDVERVYIKRRNMNTFMAHNGPVTDIEAAASSAQRLARMFDRKQNR